MSADNALLESEEQIPIPNRDIGETGAVLENRAILNSGKSIIASVKRKASQSIDYFRDWRALQQQLLIFPDGVTEDQKQIQDKLMVYRLTVIGLTYKAEKVDKEIWEYYSNIVAEIPALKRKTSARPLPLRTRKNLYQLNEAWLVLIEKQKHLLKMLSTASQALEFYNKMQIMRIRRQQEREKRAENARKIATARKSLEDAINHIDRLDEQGNHVTSGSSILHIEDARKEWKERLHEFIKLEQSGSENLDEVLPRIYQLKDAIRDSPITARWVRTIEDKFSDLVAMHDLLASYGISVIPQNEIARTTVIMFEKVPRLWANGERAEFERNLRAVEGFINYYENKVQAELAIAERRRPGMTRGLTMSNNGGDNLLISQLAALARPLMNAIDARDRLMRGHSAKVANLALQTARKMGWGQFDLDHLEVAALLHDVGKLSIPESVLTKMQPLNEDEWKMIQRHPFFGAQILKQISSLGRVVPWIYHHQEHWDGTGYPDRLSGKEIPAAASIISIAEAYTAITTDMPIRPALTGTEAIATLRKEAGKQFNPAIVEVFTEVLEP